MSPETNRRIASLFGVGYLPKAPGTWAALLGAISWYLFLGTGFFTPELQFLLFVFIIIVGVMVSNKLPEQSGKDPSFVVIDELAGIWLACFMLPASAFWILIAFVLFRILDILKPFGIRQLEKISGGWGIMLDDIVAGVLANLIVKFIIGAVN